MIHKIAIFASGSGTNTENIIQYFENNAHIQVKIVVTNKPDAYVLKRAEKYHIASFIFPKVKWNDGTEILKLLQDNDIDFIVLAGFLVKVPDTLMRAYSHRIINIHPALLPKYGGKGMYGDKVHQAVVASGEKESGITIHYINEEYDAGDIIVQYKCSVLPSDTAEDVAQKVHALEYKYYPKVIEKLLSE